MSTPGNGQIPQATIERLPGYLRVLTDLADEGVARVSSNALAEAVHVQPALLRRDLSYFGSYGTRGVGYEVDTLMSEIGELVGTRTTWSVVIVGAGNLGRALARHGGLLHRGFQVVSMVDTDETRIGAEVGGIAVLPDAELEEIVRRTGARIAVLTTPAAAAQQAADRLIAQGVTSILNFAPITLEVPEGVTVRAVDLAQELQILAFHEAHRTEPVQ